MASASVPPPELDAASTLCTSCGLCCEDALNGHVVLLPEEVEGAHALGLPVLDGDRPGFRLPCPKLVDRCCSIYTQRPWACAGYKCKLLQELDAGRVALDVALQNVITARGLFDATEADKKLPRPENERVAAERLLRLTALRLYLQKNFANPRDRKLIEQSRVGTPIVEPE